MSSAHDKDKIVERLQERIDYLEEIHRWHTFSLDLLVSMLDIHGDEHRNRDARHILSTTSRYISRLKVFDTVAFMTVDDEDSSFTITQCSPVAAQPRVQIEVDAQIDNGTFAWAINQNNAVIVNSINQDQQIILHVITTRSRVRGMFVAIVTAGDESVSHTALNLLSIILSNTAYALESASLYRLIQSHNEQLEETVEKRTKELAYQAGHDALTGLPNRLLFMDRIMQAIQRSARNGRKCVVLMMDLDKFKRVNDTLGHSVGDALLKAVSERITKILSGAAIFSPFDAVQPSISMCRLGGDEFGVLVSDMSNVHDSIKVIQRLIESISVPFKIEGHEIFLTTSVGVSAYPDDSDNAEALLKDAETAMYHAKRQGRNDYRFYSADMNSRAFEHLILENQLRHALDRDEFVLYYQPQFDLHSNQMIGVEALIRWVQPDIGMISPLQFIPIAEETGLILPIGKWVLRRACTELKQLHDRGHTHLRVAVNLSAYQFKQRDLNRVVTQTLDECRLAAGALELEITESALMEDIERAKQVLQELREMGLKISIDDFGTGYSSLNYLKQFPLDTLKIDQGFVREMLEDEQDQAIVSTIIALAHNLKLQVVAEGVECAEHMDYLRGKGCDLAQGYHLSRPLDYEALATFLERSDPS